MSCKEWNDEWVARLYDELDEEERQRLDRHLAGCPACRRMLDELQQSRELLRSAPPVPAAPRVLVLRPPRWRHPAWAFAGGLAAALLVFAAGLHFGSRPPGGASVNEQPRTTLTAAEPRGRAADDRRAAMEARLAHLERALSQLPRAEALPAVVTPDLLDERLGQFARRFQVQRTNDMEFLLAEIQATEWRAASWNDETREALRYVALRGDTQLSEQ